MRRIGKTSSANFLVFSLLFFFIFSIAFLMPIQPNDYWWYLRVAQQTTQSGFFPGQEFISYTQAGVPVTYQFWLAGMSFYAAHLLGGALATNILRGLLVAGLYAFVWFSCRRAGAGALLASGLTLLAALAGSNNWAVRPQDFGYPLFGLVLWALWRWQDGENRSLWALPLAAVLWVNLHASFILLFALGAAALLFGQGNRRCLAIALGWAVLATLVNPEGAFIWRSVIQMTGDPSIQQFSKEWMPPINSGWQMNLFFGWLLAFSVMAGLGARRLNAMHWAWFLGLGWLAISGLRYVIWFTALLAVLSAYVLAPAAARWLPRRSLATAQAFNLVLGLVLLVSPFLFLPGVREKWMPSSPPPYSENTPFQAAAWLNGHPEIDGRMWAELAFSSYLAFAVPARPVWGYPRMETFPPQQWTRYLVINAAESGWQEALAAEGICLVVVDRTNQPELLAALEASSAWRQVYTDKVAAIYACQ
jgi:hypothetical protein